MKNSETIEESKDDIFLISEKIAFNRISCELSHDNKKIKLPYTESKLLILNKNSVVSREQLIGFSWGDRIVTDSSLAKSISNLRKIFRQLEQADDCIITIPRLGYRFTLQVRPMVYGTDRGVVCTK